MRMGQGVRIGLGHGGITCVLQTQFSSLLASDQWWPFFVTFLFLVTDILCLVIQYFGKIN